MTHGSQIGASVLYLDPNVTATGPGGTATAIIGILAPGEVHNLATVISGATYGTTYPLTPAQMTKLLRSLQITPEAVNSPVTQEG